MRREEKGVLSLSEVGTALLRGFPPSPESLSCSSIPRYFPKEPTTDRGGTNTRAHAQTRMRAPPPPTHRHRCTRMRAGSNSISDHTRNGQGNLGRCGSPEEQTWCWDSPHKGSTAAKPVGAREREEEGLAAASQNQVLL